MKKESPDIQHLPPSDDMAAVSETRLEPHPAGQARYGGIRQFIRMCSFASYFSGCILVIFCTQLIGAPLYFYDKRWYYAYMARTKKHFGVLVTTITQWWSPTVVRITGDKTVRDQLRRTSDGRLECDFPDRMVLISNHQLYSDWLYLWWIAYTAQLHGFIYIILKESLKWIPVVGAGMQFYGFVFLARKWEQDKPRFAHRLSKLAANGRDDPMWLLIFPEGTNLSANGRKTSSQYAEKIGIQDLRHLLLPRSTGLRFCLEQLKGTVDWVYDCTVAYEGIPRGKYGQDYFTLSSTYFQGRPPKSVNMHWRRFSVSSIPISDAEEFEAWIRQRWLEKDNLLEYYLQNGRFPENDDVTVDERARNGGKVTVTGDKSETASKSTQEDKWQGPIETEVKLENWWEIFDVFGIIAIREKLIKTIDRSMALFFRLILKMKM